MTIPVVTIPTVPVNLTGVVPDPGPAKVVADALLSHLAAIGTIVYDNRPLLMIVLFLVGYMAALLMYHRDTYR